MTEVKALLNRAHQGDKEARDQLIQENLGLVWSIVRRFTGRGQEPEDLFQIGVIGLIKAIDKFDTGFEVRFSTYAVPMITGEIKRFLRDDGMVKVSRGLKEIACKVYAIREKQEKYYGREPTLEEVSKELGVSREDIVMAMDANLEVESIYKTVHQGDGNEICLIDKVVANPSLAVGQTGSLGNGAMVDVEKEELLNHLLLKQLLEELGQEERRLIEMRYFQNQTQSQVAATLGISQVQVSRLEKKVLLSMRQKL